MQAALRAECLRRRYAPNAYGGEKRRVLPFAQPHENGNTINLQAYECIYPKRRYAPIVNQRNMSSGATAAAARRLPLRGCPAPRCLQQFTSPLPPFSSPWGGQPPRSSPSGYAADVRHCGGCPPHCVPNGGSGEVSSAPRWGAQRPRYGAAAAHRR